MATLIDLGALSVSLGDGLLLQGRTLYVVRNRLNQIDRRASARPQPRIVVGTITDPRFDVPTTVAAFGDALYVALLASPRRRRPTRRTPCAWEPSPKAWRSAKTHHQWDEPAQASARRGFDFVALFGFVAGAGVP